ERHAGADDDEVARADDGVEAGREGDVAGEADPVLDHQTAPVAIVGGTSSLRSSGAKWQRARWPGATSRSAGTSVRQRSCANGQRVWKRQPSGTRARSPGSPLSMIRRRRRSRTGSAIGTADSRAIVYGCIGRSKNARVADRSTTWPRYMVTTSSDSFWTMLMSWEMTR